MTQSRSEIDHLKKTTDLSAYIQSRGISLSKKGRDLAGLCPFHDDRNPSLIVTPSKNLWNCVSCNAGGDIFAFVMKLDGIDFPSAFEKIREYAGIKGEDFSSSAVTSSDGNDLPLDDTLDLSSDEISQEDMQILEGVIRFYRRNLKESSRAHQYLKDRGISNPETVEKFQIGYCTEGLLKMLPRPDSAEGKHIRSILLKYGIIRESGREHFRGCITFPILDERGIFRGLYGRRIESGSRIRHLYSAGKNRGIYNPSAFSQEDLILCESIIDALTFHSNGIKNVTCIYGVNGYTDVLHEKIKRSGIKRVYVALDADDQGNASAESIMGRLNVSNIDALRVVLPSQMDINEYALKMPPAEDSLRSLLKGSVPHAEKHSVNIPVPFHPAAEKENMKPGNDKETLINGEPVISGEEIQISYGERKYRIRGLFKNTSDHQMKINLKISAGDMLYVDTLDFLSAKARHHYITNAAVELSVSDEIIKTDLARLLDALEKIQEKRSADKDREKEEIVEIPEERKEKAIQYLKDPGLIKNIVHDFERSGLAGERINALVGYLGVISRKTEAPLAIIIQSSSSAGKSTLMEAILSFVPEEDRIKYSFMTGQSLYYMQSKNLKHKIIAISEEEGIERAKYAIKILQSEGKITIATTVKDSVTGMPDTREFTVEGPVMIFLTTTNAEIDEEIQNRSLIITVNETREQTRLIQTLQRESQTLEGILRKKEKDHLSELHADCQRLLRSLEVINPFATQLDFPDHNLRARRDHMKFLTLIRTIALLHQYQRETRTEKTQNGEVVECIVATKEDVALAAFLAGEIFGISMDDLAPQTRQLLFYIDEYVKKKASEDSVDTRKIRFTRRELREKILWSDTRLRRHLDRLVELEFIIPYGGGQGKLTEYELYNPAGISADEQSAALFFLPESVELPDSELVLYLKNGVSVEKKSKDNGSSPPFDPTSPVKTTTSSPLRTHFATPERRSQTPEFSTQTGVSRQIDPTSPVNRESILREKNSSCIGITSTGRYNGQNPGGMV